MMEKMYQLLLSKWEKRFADSWARINPAKFKKGEKVDLTGYLCDIKWGIIIEREAAERGCYYEYGWQYKICSSRGNISEEIPEEKIKKCKK